MHLVYYDESGDDGYPIYSSPFFVLSAIYMHYLSWRNNYDLIKEFRRKLKNDFGLPVNLEMHTKNFLLDKNPYRDFNFSKQNRIKIITSFCEFLSSLELKIINTVIIKKNIISDKYDVLDKALTYSVQRIENDLSAVNESNKRFMIITDSGRVGKMRKTTRKIQKINYIPSKYSGFNYRKEIKYLIEDPLPKDSKESYFIQLADLVSYIITLYSSVKLEGHGLPNRLKDYVKFEDIIKWLEIIRSVLNLKASGKNIYGIVYYPK